MLRPCPLVYACTLVLMLCSTAIPSLFAQSPRPTVRSLLTGYGAVGYGAGPWGTLDHDFTATISLVPLFQIRDDVLVEGEVELDLHDGETLVALEHAEVHYLGFERVQLKAGKFHLPFGLWSHTNWVNHMPTPPLLYEDAHGEPAREALLPILFDLGAMARWNIPMSDGWRTSASFWVSQGPRVGTVEHTHDGHGEAHDVGDEVHDEPASNAPPLAYGSNYEDNNSDKMVGLQLRAMSAGGLTLQGSGFRAAYDDAGDLRIAGANAALRWAPRSGPLRLLDLRVEWTVLEQEYLHHEELEFVTYDGYYLQASRRVERFEPVIRWSHLPEAVAGHGPVVDRRRQLAFGLNYWISPSVALKGSFQWDLDFADELFLEWAVGF